VQYLARILEGRIAHLEDAGLGEGISQDRHRAAQRNNEAASCNHFCSRKAV